MKLLVIPAVLGTLLLAGSASAVSPKDYGLNEGDVIRATNDLDVYIVNESGYKRLFVNPQIFNLYGHLGFDKVKSVAPATRDTFATSGLFRNCQSGDLKVYGLEVVSEDVASLHHVNVTGAEAVSQDPLFFKKVFCINNSEQALYTAGASFNSLSEVPSYSRGGYVSPAPVVNKAVVNTVVGSQTITQNASGFTMLNVRFEGDGTVDSLKVKRLGFGDNSDYLDGVYLYKDGVRLADVRSFNSDRIATFNNLKLKAPFVLSVIADFSDISKTGHTAKIELQGDYNGLPLQSNVFAFAGASSGKVTLEKSSGTLDSLIVGGKNVQVSEFKAKALADNEDITLNHIELFNAGDSGLTNVRLSDGITSWNGSVVGDRLVFNPSVVIKSGKVKTFKVYADLLGDKNDTVELYVEKPYDVYALGNVYGFGVVVVNDLFNEVSESYQLALSAVDGNIVASSVSGDKVVALWGDTEKTLFQFKLKADKDSFELDELAFSGLDPDAIKKLYVYSGNVLVGSEMVDGNTASVSSNFVLAGEKVFTVKADFNQLDASVSEDFTPSLVAIKATGVGSEKTETFSGVNGKGVYVYSAYPTLSRTDSFGTSNTLISGVEQEVLSWSLTAIGGDVRLASTSNAFTFGLVQSGATSDFYDFRVVSNNSDLAVGSIASVSNSFSVKFTDDVVVQEGQTKEFTLYADFLNFASSGTRYFRAELKDNAGAVKWQSKDKEGEWSADLSSVIDTLNTLPLKFSQFANSN